MVTLLAFASVLLVAVFISERAHRSVVSTAVLFLVGGFALGDGGIGVIHVAAGDDVVARLAELALFAVLFTDGMKVGVRDLRRAWRLPGQALALGLPFTLLLTGALAHWVAGLPWLEALLVGAALSPTDPVFAAAIVGREQIPYRLRHLLNVESGINDGLALPVVVVLISLANASPIDPWSLLGEVVLGVALGVAVPLAAMAVQRARPFAASAAYQPLTAVAIGLILLSLAQLTGANEFLATFAGGVTIASLSDEVTHAFHQFGDLAAELLKLAALLVFGALLSRSFLADVPWTGYAFAVLALVAVRPVALGLAGVPFRLPRREWLAAAWFGPKGFASVVYGLLILERASPMAPELFHLIGLVVVLSIVAHSSTDVLVARTFASPAQEDDHAVEPADPDPGREAA